MIKNKKLKIVPFGFSIQNFLYSEILLISDFSYLINNYQKNENNEK